MEEDIVSHIELQVPVFLVILRFLLLLCSGLSLLCLSYQVLYVFCKCGCSRVHRLLVRGAESFVDWQSYVFSIEKLECWFLGRGIDIGIDCKFNIGKFVSPFGFITIEEKAA